MAVESWSGAKAQQPQPAPQNQKLLQQQIVDLFDRVEFRSFYAVRPARAIWTFTHIWLGIAAAITLAAWLWRMDDGWPKVLLPLLIFYIGTRQNAFAVQIHEASHNLLFSDRSTNDTFCNVFGGYWVLNDVQSYRAVHRTHHTDLHLSTDPDLDLYMISGSGGRFEVVRLVLCDLLWITAIRRILRYGGKVGKATAAKRAALHLAAKMACQAALLGAACSAFGWREGPVFYFLFWLAPLFSVFSAIIRLRIVTEHFSPSLSAQAERPFVSRTTAARWPEIYLFGCDMEYHFEHHLFPGIPHPQLARLHGELVRRGFFERLPPAQHPEVDYLSDGYIWFWGRLLTGSVRPLSAASKLA
jgi:fatty acid desaturase